MGRAILDPFSTLWVSCFGIKDKYINARKHKGKTTFIITTDHGRGTKPIDSWRGHGVDVKGSDQTWIIIFGKGVSPKGEVSKKGQLFNNQIFLNRLELNSNLFKL